MSKNDSVDLFSIVKKLEGNLSGLRYGSVVVALKVHSGRVVDISYTVTHTIRDTVNSKEVEKC
ncbi:hypothetical protein [Treponema primitia]|uniref:hypothetical protein n=1 Tax=Treponema primitia TaxID=88058 RepID=UPI000255585B|nr:hypothetical protein [Treponema primitia]